MSDDLDIRGGGVVSVDTETLRHAAAGFGRLAEELEQIAGLADDAAGLLALAVGGMSAGLARNAGIEIEHGVVRAKSFDRQLVIAAEVYELVELRALRSTALAAHDAAAIARIDARLASLRPDTADSALESGRGILGWSLGWPSELTDQALWGPWAVLPGVGLLAGATVYGTVQGVQGFGWGRVAAGAKLRDVGDRARIRVISQSTTLSAPTSLVIAAERIPGGGEARIRVEKYTMPDMSRQFALYVAGTQTAGAVDGSDPFDMRSNLELYAGGSAASYDATLTALQVAGAQPGDVVHAFGHSQGAMVTAHLALESEFDIRTLVSFGSPIAADLGDDTLSVMVRHADDPIAALAGGGYAHAVGAPGSFVAERVADPSAGAHDVATPGHAMTAYAQTAAMLDGSRDPRMDPVRALLHELEGATTVQTTEYGAERVLPGEHSRPRSPRSSGGGGV